MIWARERRLSIAAVDGRRAVWLIELRATRSSTCADEWSSLEKADRFEWMRGRSGVPVAALCAAATPCGAAGLGGAS